MSLIFSELAILYVDQSIYMFVGEAYQVLITKNKQSFNLFHYDINVICHDLDKYINGIV